MAALPLHLTRPWVLPYPFDPPQAPTAPTARLHFPRLDPVSCDRLEEFMHNISDPKGFPTAPQTNVALALNVSLMWHQMMLDEAWSCCLGLIRVTKLGHNFSFPGTLLEEDLNCTWTTVAGATVNRAPAGGPLYPRYRFLYVIHLHPGASADTNSYSLSVYDRETRIMGWHDPGTGLPAHGTARQGQVNAFWAAANNTFAGCPGFGVVTISRFYSRFNLISCLSRNSNPPPRPTPNAKRSLFNVISWCVEVISWGSAYPPPAGRFSNDFDEAAGFTGLAHLYVSLFLILHANSTVPVDFRQLVRFVDSATISAAYGANVAKNELWTSHVNVVIGYMPAAYWPANVPNWARTWQEALIC